MTFGVELPPRRRFPAFAGSLGLHGAALSLLSLQPASFYVTLPQKPKPVKYSARLLQLQVKDFQIRHLPNVHNSQDPPPNSPGRQQHQALDREPGAETSAQELPAKASIRHWELPLAAKIHRVPQTLVQMDLPTDLQLKHEVPIPTMLWAIQLPATQPTDPSTPRPRPAAEMDSNLPEPPVLERPNQEQNVATQKVALSPTKEIPHLSRIPATTSPVVKMGSQMAIEIPQIAPPSERDQPIPALISLANQNLQSVVVALPPANQVAETRLQTKMISETGSGASVAAKSAALSNAVAASNGRSTNSPTPAADAALPVPSAELPGTKRLTRPKDGRFAAVVVGSASAGPYSEQPSPLQGKVIYTVHVDVGFRKKWILQYSVISGEEFGNSDALEGPWPVVLVIPTALNALDLDYLMVHGIISAEGKFDHLALTYPTDYEEKGNLVKALGQWEFRPARRGQGNAAVEVLLIIPRQPE